MYHLKNYFVGPNDPDFIWEPPTPSVSSTSFPKNRDFGVLEPFLD